MALGFGAPGRAQPFYIDLFICYMGWDTSSGPTAHPLVAQPGWLPHPFAALLTLIGPGTGGTLPRSLGLDSWHLLE